MQLVNFSYNDNSWKLDDLYLQAVNLIVGRNASGKSRTLSSIESLADVLSQRRQLPHNASWRVQFLSATQQKIDYSIAIKASGQIIREVFALDGKLLIDRKLSDENSFSRVLNRSTNKMESFFPPEDKLVLHVRRDIKAYPEFERLIEWAANSYGFRFGTISPLNALADSGYDFMNPVEDLVEMFRQLSPSQTEEIVRLVNEMGYEITSIEWFVSINSRLLKVTERGIPTPILHSGLSQGMFRIVALLIYFTYLIRVKRPQLITIDDLGEGLDYSRVYKLGKFIFEACQQANVQLIATSNDGFLMDVIPIDYWNVLRRNGTEITALNEKNNSELFENFAFTGLSNFDFFSSDYIDSHLK
jgi:energy-coupling factor transporter ATP-binding protein EcfA2